MSQIFRRCSDASRLPPNVQLAAHRRIRGFTLIELMVTVGVAAILMAIAAPSFRNITISNKLTTTANDVVGAVNIARMEAITRNTNTQLCSDLATNNGSDTLGAACTTQAQPGAVLELVPDVNGALQPNLLRAGTSGIAAPVALTGNMVAIRFGGNGLGYAITNTSTPFSGLVADISSSAISTNNHRCINMTGGSIIVTTSQSGACS